MQITAEGLSFCRFCVMMPLVIVWKRGYYDHVIRSGEDYEMVAKYMYENPIRREGDT